MRNRKYVIVHGEQANYCTDIRFLFPAMQTTDPEHSSHLVQYRETPIAETDKYLLERLDAVVIQRPSLDVWKNVVAYYTQLRQKYPFNIVVDYDDALWEIHKSCDDVLKYIAKGINYVTVSTENLKKAVESKYGVKVIVVPNGVADNMIHKVSKTDKVILYGGAGGHASDWNKTWKKAINELIGEGFKFYSCQKKIDGIDKGDVYPWSLTSNWGKTICELNPAIYIAPLGDNNVINSYKSNLKFLEAAAMEIPFIGSKIKNGPYNFLPARQTIANTETVDSIVSKINDAYNNPVPIVEFQNKYLSDNHLRMTDPMFIGRWLNSYINGEQQPGW